MVYVGFSVLVEILGMSSGLVRKRAWILSISLWDAMFADGVDSGKRAIGSVLGAVPVAGHVDID